MEHSIDLFRHPDKLDDVTRLIKVLETQKKIVQAFEHTANLLQSPHLHSRVLGNCSYFINAINASAISSNFYIEVSKLNLWELAFCAISFGEKRLQAILDDFRASDLTSYMGARGISSGHRTEIFRRLDYYCRGKNDKFRALYDLARTSANNIRQIGSNKEEWRQDTRDSILQTTNSTAHGLPDDGVQYTLCYGVKSQILPLFTHIFNSRMAAVPTWGTTPVTTSVRANVKTSSVEFEIDLGVGDVDLDLSKVFANDAWGIVESRKMNQVVVRTDRNQGAWLANSIFFTS